MDGLITTLVWIQRLAYIAVGLWAFRRWRRHGDEASRWLAATFGSLGTVVLLGAAIEDMPPSRALELFTLLLIAILLPFPYYLLRFLDTFEPVSRRLRRIIGSSALATCVAPVVMQSLLDPEMATQPLNRLYSLAIVLTWVAALGVVARRFWRAARGQPTMVRRRLRTLSLGSLSLGFAMVVSGANPGAEAGAAYLAIQLLAVGSASLFLLGFAPPAIVRAAWRAPEERGLHEASVQLMSATDPQGVADILVPHLRAVIAAEGVAIVQDDVMLGQAGAIGADPGDVDAPGHQSFPLSRGEVHVWSNAYTPFFGQEEQALLERLALLADLAIDRAALFASEREARTELESANAELESFIYSASHDLKSPLIALQSYVDVLSTEYHDALDEQAHWFLGRMKNNCEYMGSLVGDLLELSRVGRVETVSSAVDLGGVLDDVAQEVNHRFAGAEVTVGEMPTIWINDLRARQLMRNLVENAAAHGRPEGVHIDVRCEPSADEPGTSILYVRDDGVGIPEAYRERVFGVFERLEAETDGSTGTGIGLAICRKIVDAAGGAIWVTDHAGGAEFAIKLPPAMQVPPGTGGPGTLAAGTPTPLTEVHA